MSPNSLEHIYLRNISFIYICMCDCCFFHPVSFVSSVAWVANIAVGVSELTEQTLHVALREMHSKKPFFFFPPMRFVVFCFFFAIGAIAQRIELETRMEIIYLSLHHNYCVYFILERGALSPWRPEHVLSLYFSPSPSPSPLSLSFLCPLSLVPTLANNQR